MEWKEINSNNFSHESQNKYMADRKSWCDYLALIFFYKFYMEWELYILTIAAIPKWGFSLVKWSQKSVSKSIMSEIVAKVTN